MNVRGLAGAWLAIASICCGNAAAETISYQFSELLDGSNVAFERTPFELGAAFSHVDAATIELEGSATSHTWEVRLCGTNQLVELHDSNTWVVYIRKPGMALAGATLLADGDFNEELAFWHIQQGWEDPLEIEFRPVPSGVWLAIFTLVLASSPEVSLTKADLHVSGTVAPGTVVPEPTGLISCLVLGCTLLMMQRAVRCA
ncbi:MAG: hypothetical protein GX621_00540 [Pirellulaceae bacterium]|nr:hypothetical protein [Pirellulaceae bacterium]